MQGSDDDAAGSELPEPPDGAQPVAPVFAPDTGSSGEQDADAIREPPGAEPPATPASERVRDDDPDPDPDAGPVLPGDVPPSAPRSAEVAPTGGDEAHYRTDRDRHRSVTRLANPWYRRLARGLVGMVFIAAAALGVYVAAQFIGDLLDRDQLPAENAEVPIVRSTTIEIRSAAPAPVLDGTLTLDTVTGSFEFVGRGTGAQAGMQVVSPDGETTYVRRDAGAWQPAPAGDRLAADVLVAVDYLRDDVNADAILTRPLRHNYAELVERTEIGEGDAEVRRYEMQFDTAAFQENFPIEYQEFAGQAIPGVVAVRSVMVTITIDADDVLVQVDDATTNWSWQRLSYSDQAYVSINPSIVVATGTADAADG